MTTGDWGFREAASLEQADSHFDQQALSEGVANRGSVAHGVRGGELHVVVDQIEAPLWTKEDMLEGVPFDASAEIRHQVVAAGEAISPAAGSGIETGILSAHAGYELGCQALGQFGGPDGIHIPENRTVGKIEFGGKVNLFTCLPVEFALHSDGPFLKEQNVEAAAEVGSAVEGLWLVIATGRGAGRRRIDGACSKSNLNALRLRDH